MVLLHIILEDMSSQQMLQESNREHRIPYQLNLVDIRKSVIISSNPCHQWSIEYSVESVDIMRSQTLSQGYGKYIKCALCTLYLALSRSISQSAGFVQYLCKQKDGKQSTPSASLVAPVSGGQSVTTDICENPVASVLSVFNSPLTITNGTISGEGSQLQPNSSPLTSRGAEVLKNQKKKIKRDRSPSSREYAYCRFAQNLIFL